ncbi:MAG: hypothetical protein JWM24_184 [Solirubrobacterales bacterium]|nr:hypothetical protein [Solirubrobacterales bacterium]
MKVENGVIFPDPQPYPRPTLTREDAINIFRALDEQGLSCTLSSARGAYVVRLDVDGLTADVVTNAIGKVQSVVLNDDIHIQFDREYLTIR